MKSNEEFIAGIYEKAAFYTEEKSRNVNRLYHFTKEIRTAAMIALCLGLAGAGTLLHSRQEQSTTLPVQSEDYGIALLAEDVSQEAEAGYQSRRMIEPEKVTYTGKVKTIDTKEKRIWIALETGETDMLCIKWELQEEISEDIRNGVKLTVTGQPSLYENETSVHNGCIELVLTDSDDLWMNEEGE